jgi:hypothetical protein
MNQADGKNKIIFSIVKVFDKKIEKNKYLSYV